MKTTLDIAKKALLNENLIESTSFHPQDICFWKAKELEIYSRSLFKILAWKCKIESSKN